MNPEELKALAIASAKNEIEGIITTMKKLAKEESSFSYDFSSISDGAMAGLQEQGYNVQKIHLPSNSLLQGQPKRYKYTVSIPSKPLS